MPSDKRARQRAGRATRMAELQRAQQQRRRRTRVYPIIAAVVIIVAVLIFVTGHSGHSKSTKTATSTSTTATTAHSTTPTTVATASSVPLGTGLTARTAPAISSACTTPASASTTTTTTPAKGNAVSIVAAPAHVPFPSLNGSSPRYTKFSSAPPFCIDASKTYTATVTTDVGVFTIELLPKYAPVTVNSFVFLAGYHYFDGIIFHRVIPGFVDQTGDPTGTGSGGPGYQFKDELPTSASAYQTGSVAMANSGANTNGSQFFIVVPGGGSQLTPSYSVFGQVTSGISVIEKINADGASSGTPTKIHKIEKVTISES